MSDKPLYFVDYIFQLNDRNNIFFDKELKLDHLNMKEGDNFEVRIIDNQIALIKQ